jgi:hypothetical protein
MSDNLDAVLRRVQKLLAIAQDERADPNEAAAAAQQAEKIMRKYQLDNADVVRKEFADADNFGSDDCVVIMKRDVKGAGAHKPVKVPAWGQWLAVRVAKYLDCQATIGYNAVKGACITFRGYKSDVQVASWTFDYLVGCVISAVRRFQKAAPRAKAESESYRRGFVMSLLGLIDREIAAKAAEQQASSTSRELVVAKAQAVAQHFGETKYRDKKVSVRDQNAYGAGRADGAKVQMRQGVRNDGGTGQLRLGN